MYGCVLGVCSHLSPAQEAIQHRSPVAQLVGDIDHVATEEAVTHAHEWVGFRNVQIGDIRSVIFVRGESQRCQDLITHNKSSNISSRIVSVALTASGPTSAPAWLIMALKNLVKNCGAKAVKSNHKI